MCAGEPGLEAGAEWEYPALNIEIPVVLGMIWTDVYSDLIAGTVSLDRRGWYILSAGRGKVLKAAAPPFCKVICTDGRDGGG